MNLTRKLIITSTLISTLAVAGAYACGSQNGGNQRGAQIDPAQRFEYIFNQLDLSADQRSGVLSILEDLQAQRDERRSTMQEQVQSLNDRPSVEEMQAIREANRASMLTQLTDELNTVLPADDTAAFINYIEFHSQRMDRHGHSNGNSNSNGNGHHGMQRNNGANNPTRQQ
jgi:hypothetical protein